MLGGIGNSPGGDEEREGAADKACSALLGVPARESLVWLGSNAPGGDEEHEGVADADTAMLGVPVRESLVLLGSNLPGGDEEREDARLNSASSCLPGDGW